MSTSGRTGLPCADGGAVGLLRLSFLWGCAPALGGIIMGFDLPDYSYGMADSVLAVLDYMIRVATDTTDGVAAGRLEEARQCVMDYKALILDRVLE